MTKKQKAADASQKPIEQYEHKDKDRVNNPPVGLVDSKTDNGGQKKKTYEYDPHLDPQLQWAGKAEHTSFEVPTVSLHVHERIDPRKIIETVRRVSSPTVREGSQQQPSLFEQEKKPLREAIEFYKHKDAWSNRLIAGDSLLVMNSLLEKEGMAGKVQMVYFDPPYGIKYGSNFQPFVNKRDVKDGKDEDLTAEPEMIKAFRDTWELGIHSYLTYLRDRLLLAKELLSESGSIFVQISDENVHHVREMLDEVFGVENFVALISFRKTGSQASKTIGVICDYLVLYSKNLELFQKRFRKLYKKATLEELDDYNQVLLTDGTLRKEKLTKDEARDLNLLPDGARVFQATSLQSDGRSEDIDYRFDFMGQTYEPNASSHWKTSVDGLKTLASNNRITKAKKGKSLRYIRFFEDFPFRELNSTWTDTYAPSSSEKEYVVQTSEEVVTRCLLMTTDPGDLVLDITCGSGTTAFVAENWGRRWITCDTSRVAVALAKQRLMTADFDYFELAHPDEGVGSGFKYKTVPHITLKSIANNEPAPQETLYDQPFVDNKKLRITGPFTVEAVPAPYVKSADDGARTLLSAGEDASSAVTNVNAGLAGGTGDADRSVRAPADASIARSGETLRQSEWIDRLKDGIRGKGGSKIEFSRVEMLSGTHFLQAEAETVGARTLLSATDDASSDVTNVDLAGGTGDADKRVRAPQRVVICFGPEHAPLDASLVSCALDEAEHLRPSPQMILFCAFQFDSEARKDIDGTKWEGVQLLEVQMDTDLHTHDLKKKPRDKTNPGYWLIGQPDVSGQWAEGSGQEKMYTVSVHGFDYYNPKTGQVESGGKGDIAMWMLDPDYDDRSLFPTQVFFPMAGDKEGWAKLAKNLKAEIDLDKIEAFRGTVSLPFKPGRKVAVKIIDARGIESLKIIHV